MTSKSSRTSDESALAMNWRENIINDPAFRTTILGKDNKEYSLLYFNGANYQNQGGQKSVALAAQTIYGIIRSNEKQLKEHGNWTFDHKSAMGDSVTTLTILPKQDGSYSGILIDPELLSNSGIPKIVGYIICTAQTNEDNGQPYVDMDFVELHSQFGQGRGLCTPLIAAMINWLKYTMEFNSFKIWNASSTGWGIPARKCYLRAGESAGLELYYMKGNKDGWNLQAPPIRINENPTFGIFEKYGRRRKLRGVPQGRGETYFMVHPDIWSGGGGPPGRTSNNTGGKRKKTRKRKKEKTRKRKKEKTRKRKKEKTRKRKKKKKAQK